MRSLRTLLLLTSLFAASTSVAATVHAAPIVRDHYSGTDSGTFDDSGFDINFEVEFSGVFMLKQGRKGDPTPYYFDNYDYRTVYTNADTGAWLTQSGNGLYKDLKIVNVSGTVYRFEAIEVGRPFRIHDMDGKLVIADRGHLRVGFTVDTLGDSDLDNDIFVDGSFELLADNGSHPGFYVDFCDIANDLIG